MVPKTRDFIQHMSRKPTSETCRISFFSFCRTHGLPRVKGEKEQLFEAMLLSNLFDARNRALVHGLVDGGDVGGQEDIFHTVESREIVAVWATVFEDHGNVC